MNSLVKVFSNFKEFYSEINGATLTGAIDVIVVEQPDGEFQCSPFHVRFGKLGVLRSREKVVDIEINGEPVDIHMKLGESGEAFFVEECPEEDVEELPDNLATSPIPTSYFPSKFVDDTLEEENNVEPKTASEDIQLTLPLPLPRRNSIDFSKEAAKDCETEPKFENQISDFSHRRYTDNVLERRNLSDKLKEYTTQKIRQEWAEHEEIFQFDAIEKDQDWNNSTNAEGETPQQIMITAPPEPNEASSLEAAINAANEEEQQQQQTKELNLTISNATNINASSTNITSSPNSIPIPNSNNINNNSNLEHNSFNNAGGATAAAASIKGEESKGKKKRRKKSQMKKKNAQRKSSSSSSVGSNTPLEGMPGGAASAADVNGDNGDAISMSISNNTNSSSNDEATPQTGDQPATASNNKSGGGTGVGDESPRSSGGDRDIQTTTPTTTNARIPDLDIHFFSDTEVTNSSGGNCSLGGRGLGGAGRPSTPIQSDSELEISLREKDADAELMSQTASWKWGELPTPPSDHSEKIDGSFAGGPAAQAQAQRNSMLSGMFNFMKKTNKMRKHANADGGVYLADLDAGDMDPEMAAMYFPNSVAAAAAVAAAKEQSSKEQSPRIIGGADDDRESGNGTSLPHSPSSMEGQKSLDSDYEDGKPQDGKYLDFVAMSLCGVNEKGDPSSDDEFDRHLIKYSDVCENPSLFSSPNLVVRLNGKYYSWAAACPIVMTIITFQKPLSNDAIEQLMTNAKQDAVAACAVGKNEVDGSATTGAAAAQAKRSWWYWRRSQTAGGAGAAVQNVKMPKTDDKNDDKDADQTAVATATQTTRPNSPDVSENTLSKTDSTLNAENTSALVENLEDLSQVSTTSEPTNNKNERFKKSLRLSSEAIKKLNLKDGMNEIEFSVTTAYQGTTRCKCYLFRWRHNDKVVISDIDGTITKSDVLGHILPMVGKDWAQLGVAQLFSKIEQNGYKLLYLSARAIGQSRATREYLRSIRQGDVKLPDGPLLLNPTSLISAFHREVIERKPEQFKIACLSDIRDLFPDKDPFYAGYGNRINDVWAYRAVGIPIMRIFTINTKGELKHELTQTFQSSGYINQSLEVDEHFPALELNEYEYKTDVFDDDEEDELKFSETDDDDEDDDNDFNDDYVDDGIGFEEDDNDAGLIIGASTFASRSSAELAGNVKNEIAGDQTSYCSMTYIVDQLFPPIKAIDEGSIEFSNFNYWRDPIPELELELDGGGAAVTAAAAAATAVATVAATAPNTPNTTSAAAAVVAVAAAADAANVSKNANLNSSSSLSKTLSTIPEN